MRAVLLWYQNLDKYLQKGNDRLISLINLSINILKKILANQVQHCIKGIIYHLWVGFIPGIQDGSTSETLCKTSYHLAKEGKSHDYTNVQEKC